MKFTTYFFICFLSFLTSASAHELTENVLGQYQYTYGFDNNYQYLDCSDENPLIVSGDMQELSLNGPTLSPLVFKNIDEAPTSITGPIVSYSQVRTITTEDSLTTRKIENQYRECYPLLGKMGCLGQKWQTNAWVEFSMNDDFLVVQLGYKPFEDSKIETCTFVKK
jgi:hypothetical protein